MTLSLFNLVIGLLGMGLFAGVILLLNKWQKKEPFLTKVLGWSGLGTIVVALVYTFVGTMNAATLNVPALFILLLGSIVLSVFAFLATQQITRPNTHLRELGYLLSGVILTLGAGLALVLGAGLVSSATLGVIVPLALGWLLALIVWLGTRFH